MIRTSLFPFILLGYSFTAGGQVTHLTGSRIFEARLQRLIIREEDPYSGSYG